MSSSFMVFSNARIVEQAVSRFAQGIFVKAQRTDKNALQGAAFCATILDYLSGCLYPTQDGMAAHLVCACSGFLILS
jgi:hypothetical protein